MYFIIYLLLYLVSQIVLSPASVHIHVQLTAYPVQLTLENLDGFMACTAL